MLTTASVVGREFDLRLMTKLMDGLSEDQLLDALDEALAARKIEEIPGTPGRYQFSHGLLQQTLLEELSVSRRVRLHARIGAGLEELYGAEADLHASELARHFTESEPVTGPAKLVHYALIAGQQALATYAYEEALALFETALAAKGSAPDDIEIASLLNGLGRAQAAMDRPHEATASLTRAFDYFVKSSDAQRALAIAEYPIIALPGTTGLAPIISRALELVPAGSPEAGRLLSRHIRPLAVEQGDHEGARKAAEQALEIAERENDSNLALRILAESADVDAHDMRFDAALGQSLQAIKLSSEVDEPHAASGAYYWASTIQRLTGDSDGARLHATGGLALAETLRDRFRLMGFLLANGELARLQGDWDAAREFSERGISEAPREAVFLALRAMLEHQVGDVGQGESYLERLLDHLESAPFEPTFLDIYCAMAVPAVARITGKKTHLKTAEELLKGALSSHHATRLVATAAGAGLGAISVQTGDTNDQKTRYEALNGVGDMLLCQVGTSGFLALLLGALENWSGPRSTSRRPYRYTSGRGIARSWPGPVPSMRTFCSSAPMKAMPRRRRGCWTRR